MRTGHIRDSQLNRLPIDLQGHLIVVSRQNHALEATAIIQWHRELHRRSLADESSKMLTGKQWPFNPWRRDLQRVLTRYRLFDIHQGGHFATDSLTVFDSNALYTLINKDPDDAVLRIRLVFDTDQLIAQAKTTGDPEERFAILARAEDILMTELPITPQVWANRLYLMDPRVRNWTPNLLDNQPYKFVDLQAE